MRYYNISYSDIQYRKGGFDIEIDYKAIGMRIRNIRKSRKWTQETLAEISSVEPSNISHIERGATKVSLPTLMNIANALEVSLDDLVCDSLIKNEHISLKNIDELLADCSAKELSAIVEAVKHTKTILRKYGE